MACGAVIGLGVLALGAAAYAPENLLVEGPVIWEMIDYLNQMEPGADTLIFAMVSLPSIIL